MSRRTPMCCVSRTRTSRAIRRRGAMNDDPLIAHETQPTQTVAEMVRADERLEEGVPLITLPVLILHGTRDKATKPSGSQRFFEQAGSTDKTLKLYEGALPRPPQRHRQGNGDGRHQGLDRRACEVVAVRRAGSVRPARRPLCFPSPGPSTAPPRAREDIKPATAPSYTRPPMIGFADAVLSIFEMAGQLIDER